MPRQGHSGRTRGDRVWGVIIVGANLSPLSLPLPARFSSQTQSRQGTDAVAYSGGGKRVLVPFKQGMSLHGCEETPKGRKRSGLHIHIRSIHTRDLKCMTK